MDTYMHTYTHTCIKTRTNTYIHTYIHSKSCPKGSCCGPGFCNIQYTSLLNLEFRKQTKAIAFADDLLIAVKAEVMREAENITNIEMSKLSNWAHNNKINFNEEKSTVIIISRSKIKEYKEKLSHEALYTIYRVFHDLWTLLQKVIS